MKKEGIKLTMDELGFFGPDGIVVTPFGNTIDLYKNLTQMGDFVSVKEYVGRMEAAFKGSSNQLLMDVSYGAD
ncbi:hypothetical protein [Sporosarcina highlanderae]|uniref:Uncharacterized protein n=1 Tax=Sporosarcina highlanderae TaxID=3035916 RepID=A0ABT8JL68_9BACL|nr:hypothetical protein [Sporosarcina highlanderae]MDN4605898.1 hypothetical protein [Sporosarcina highlanderae]